MTHSLDYRTLDMDEIKKDVKMLRDELNELGLKERNSTNDKHTCYSKRIEI